MGVASIGAILLDEKDNVATALRPLRSGELIRLRGGKGTISITPVENIPTGHKVALTDIRRGDCVIKYGETIGEASAFIPKGSYVHVHNLRGRGGLNR
ncbi:MAG: UxaA family hydrolase [Candidatus Bathyarchaeia archaeon]